MNAEDKVRLKTELENCLNPGVEAVLVVSMTTDKEVKVNTFGSPYVVNTLVERMFKHLKEVKQ